MVVFACRCRFRLRQARVLALSLSLSLVTAVIIAVVVVSAEFAYAEVAGFTVVLLVILIINTIYKSDVRVSIFWLISTLIIIRRGANSSDH